MSEDKKKQEEDRTHLNLYQRLNKVMEEVGYVQREKKSGMQFAIVSHDAVTGAVRPSLVKWGVLATMPEMAIEQVGNRTELRCIVRFINVDNPADQLDVKSAGYGLGQDDKGPGKAMSYAYKYALMKTLMMEAGEEDPDFHQMMKTPKGEDDPVFQNITEFLEALKQTEAVEELTGLSDKYKAYLADAAKKYPQEVNEARAKFTKKLAEAKKKETK